MKYAGKKITTPKAEVIVIPRADGDIVIKAQAIMDYEEFDKICPSPEPPVKMYPGGRKAPNPEDPKYLEAIDGWATKKMSWMLLKSLEATEDLEFETIDKSNPDTWENYQQEFKDAGFSPVEVARIINIVTDACGLNQDKIDEATKRFLADQGQQPST